MYWYAKLILAFIILVPMLLITIGAWKGSGLMMSLGTLIGVLEIAAALWVVFTMNTSL